MVIILMRVRWLIDPMNSYACMRVCACVHNCARSVVVNKWIIDIALTLDTERDKLVSFYPPGCVQVGCLGMHVRILSRKIDF